jgi:hypothetical protein
MSDRELLRIELDPKRQTADADRSNNHWPPKLEPSRFKLFKDGKPKNEMQKAEPGQDPVETADDKKEPKTDPIKDDKKIDVKATGEP